jgi:hypothetical protein
MGYTTEFEGRFDLDKPLNPEHLAYLKAFSEQRHMIWNMDVIATIPDPIREAAGLPLGKNGEYFVGNYRSTEGAYLDSNKHTIGLPSTSCGWVPSEDGLHIQWGGNEKFGYYREWLRFIATMLLKPWDYTLSGKVSYQGEDQKDFGVLEVINGSVFDNGFDEMDLDSYT